MKKILRNLRKARVQFETHKGNIITIKLQKNFTKNSELGEFSEEYALRVWPSRQIVLLNYIVYEISKKCSYIKQEDMHRILQIIDKYLCENRFNHINYVKHMKSRLKNQGMNQGMNQKSYDKKIYFPKTGAHADFHIRNIIKKNNSFYIIDTETIDLNGSIIEDLVVMLKLNKLHINTFIKHENIWKYLKTLTENDMNTIFQFNRDYVKTKIKRIL